MSTINYNYYNNRDHSVYFSLDNLNEEILEALKNNDTKSNKIPQEVLYFFNPKRKNLLSWYEFKNDAEVLVINDNFGFVSESICDKVKNLTLVESSKQIAEITNLRLKDKENVEIFVGNFMEMTFINNFDYVVLLDTIKSPVQEEFVSDPYKQFFMYLNYFTKVDCKLILSLSNMLGLQYLNGAFNEKTGTIFTDLTIPMDMASTSFTKKEYARIAEVLDFKNPEWYYPIPNQFAPEIVLSEDELKTTQIEKYYKDYSLSYKALFNESSIIKDIIDADKFYLFANSYLLFLDRSNIVDLEIGEF
jgi:hypothetical protein